MAVTAIVNNERRHLERLVFLPVFFALALIWGGLVQFALIERRSAIDRVQNQLGSTVSTLARFNEAAVRSGAGAAEQANAGRTAAFWHALLQYPTASFWVESHGRVVAGQPPAGNAASIVAQDTRGAFTVHAALPEAEALKGWKRAMWLSVITLSAVTLAFLVMTRFLKRAMRERAAAEREAAASAERATQLALYRAQLEDTVARRTEELAQANLRLENELAERRAVQGALRERDALLNAVTKSAAELLGSQSHEDAIATVLELIGKTVSVSRVQSTKIEVDGNGHFRSSLQQEWCAPGIPSMIDNPAFADVDLTSDFPNLIDRMRVGVLASFYVSEIAMPYRKLCELAGIRSGLHIPILVKNALWGSLTFIDSSETKRHWSWAETDTLKTLAGLVGVAATRERYVKELADANTIVQNSPTILYRLRGEPPFRLMYVSNNIEKFGHDPVALMRSPDWVGVLVDPRDRPAVAAAMTGMLERGADGDSLEFRLRTGGGGERWVESRYSARRDKDGRLLEVEGIVIDIGERKAAEEKIELLARTDSLTGLANRATFLERLRQAYAATQRGAQPFAIMYLDLDSFKSVNDTLGHAAGDRLLREVADRLISCTRDTDLVARLGGDEFALLQAQIDEPASAGVLAAKIHRSLAVPYLLSGSEIHNTVSIGICPYSSSSTGPDAMLAQADLALYRSKEEGRNQYRFYSAGLDLQVLGRVEFAEDLKKALDDGELEFYCEPQADFVTGEVVDLKALVRWHHPTRGLLAPGDFIPMLEKTPSGIALWHWLLERACREMGRLRKEGSALPVVAIDIRFWQLKNGEELVRDVRETLAKWDLTPADLEVDVTEETLAQATLTQNTTLRRLSELGVKIAIADFGAACSSFEYIRAYCVSRIKLSQPFISSGFVQPDVAATIHAAVGFAQEIGIGVIAEGLQTEKQRASLLSPRSISRGHDARFAEAPNALAIEA